LLADTYGVILYQEQVLRIAHELAGLSLADADLLRRAMSHFNPGKQMDTLRRKFIEGAWRHSDVPEETAERVWDLMAAFAGYGFPKAHAASYAIVSWRAAWCKTHFPAQFMASVLANWGGYYSQRIYLTEARRLGLELRPPHVNYAHREFKVHYLDGEPVLFMGLDQVRELSARTQNRILKERPFRSMSDFLTRADPRLIEAENLVRSGCLGGFGSIPTLLRQLSSPVRHPGQLALFEMGNAQQLAEDEWSLEEQVAAQKLVLGVGVAAHELELAADKIAATGAINILDAAARLGQEVRVAGMRQTWRRTRTMQGGFIYFMGFEDLEGMLDVIIPGEVYRRNQVEIKGDGPFILEGRVEQDRISGEPVVLAQRMWRVI
jgi:DNA polymerase III alpha subunit